MKMRLHLFMVVGMVAGMFLTLWLVLSGGAASADPASAAMPAATIVGGNIITDTTWTLAGSPYILQTQNVTVIDNVKLIIEPGVTVEFNTGRSLLVNGTLEAAGTLTQPITFTRMTGATGPWGMVQLGGGTVMTDSNTTRLSYVTVEGGGLGSQMVYAYRSAPSLEHVTLRNSSTRCLYATSVPTGLSLTWDGGTVTGCGWEGIYVTSGRAVLIGLTVSGNTGDGIVFSSSAHDSQLLDSIVQSNGGHGIHLLGSKRLLLEGLTIDGNAGYGIFVPFDGAGGGADCIVRDTTVQGNAVAARLHPDIELENVTWTGNTRSEIEWISANVYHSRTWPRWPEISTYRVLGDITVRDEAKLSVEPGVTVQFAEYVGLKAMGGLWADGTPSQPITFTLVPGATHPWGSLEIGGGGVSSNSDDSRISYATIEGGGYGGKLVHLYYTSATLDHVTVRNSSSNGIQVLPFAGTQVTLDTVAVTDNAGIAIYHTQPGPSLSYRNLTLQGNGTDVISIAGGEIRSPMQWNLADSGAPVRVGALTMYGGALALMPGTRLEFAASTGLEVWVNSGFYALGTPDDPVTLTGVLQQPGAWKGVKLAPRSNSILRNCNIEYGGAAGEPALVIQSPDSAVIAATAVRHAAGDGVYVDTATPPVLSFNEVSGNAFGVRNNRPTVPVDARQVWWGDASGPYHPTLNPGGLGNAVGDGVLFDPWLTDVPTGTVPPSDLIVRTAGPKVVSPGQSAVFGATYLNATGQDIHDAVLVLVLPADADFVEAYPASGGEDRGIYWSERHHVFWRLGTVPAGSGGMVAARLRFPWGLPARTDIFMAMMGGSDPDLATAYASGGSAPFDVLAYMAQMPIDILSTTVLTPSEVDSERQAYPDLNTLFTQASSEGFVYTSAERYAITGGMSVVSIVLDRPDDSAITQIVRVEQLVHAYISDENSYTLRTVSGDMVYDRATATVSFTGALGAGQRSTSCTPPSDPLSFTGLRPNILPAYPADDPPEFPPDYWQCYANCMREIDDRRAINWWARGDLGTIRFLKREIQSILEYRYCETECEDDPNSNFCHGPLLTCGGRTHIYATLCDFPTGRYKPGQVIYRLCSENNPPQKCVYGPTGYPMCAECGKGTGRDCNTLDVRVAKDPNAKVGPAWDLLPGDLVSYTITYENEGEGTAYGVYVEDTLSEVFDEATLVIGQGGLYLPVSRTILWNIGELGPHGSPTASGSVTFTAQLRSDLPGGTVVINQGVVYFPSVPEETLTNQVVNVILPVVGVPVSATVQAGHAVSILLTGRDPGGSPLTFTVVEPPVRGTLTGTPPALTYTAPAGFAGQDRFTFTASNAITESRPAEVTVLVVPDPADTTPPTVVWTVPQNNAVVTPISDGPVFTDTIGSIYAPYLFVGFSEVIDASTVTTNTLRITGPDDTAIPVTVYYDSVTGEAVALLRQPLEPTTWYTVRITQGIKDLVGNPLPADFVWTFRTAGGRMIYLPLVHKS